MFLLDQTIAHLANQQHQREGFLSAARAAWGLKPNADGADRLVEVTDFGSNPGDLRMLQYVPPALSAAPALVVVLHGCAQTAAGYDHGAGWSALAERCGFALLLPEQKRESNPNGCFPWFARAIA